MMQSDDADRLRTQQYHNAQKLSARISLHARYSASSRGLFDEFFDRLLPLAPADARLLEIGCGRGDLWKHNAGRIPSGWHITLTDFSTGMLDDCQARLGEDLAGRFVYEIADAQNIPYPDDTFDVVIANFMLYHVPDRLRAIAEFRRVLKPTGVFLGMTNGERHMQELMQLAESHIPVLAEMRNRDGFSTDKFSLENGGEQLRSAFDSVELQRVPDHLFVTESQPILDYIDSLSSRPGVTLMAGHEAAIRADVERHIAADGGFYITKDSGIFIAS